jgi:hypothetical protein
MRKLPYYDYPRAADTAQHGVQPLPVELPVMNLDAGNPYRSETYKAIVIDKFNHQKVLDLARMMAGSFAIKEPMARHIQLPKHPPVNIQSIKHIDPYGEVYFGDWTKENILFWMIRLVVLTDPTSPINNIKLNSDIFTHSLAILNDQGNIIGGALNLPASHEEQRIRDNDPFINAVFLWFKPIYQLLISQDKAALDHLAMHYNNFERAFKENRVGIFFMVARSPLLVTEDTFELVAATVERFKELGYAYVVTNAFNQWTGAAFELLNAVRVHFFPYRAVKELKESNGGLPDEPSSNDGYLSDKDSGGMFYVLRIR